MDTSIIILGAGLAGLTTAYWLHLAGARVHVVDGAAGPGLGTSYANGGLVTPSQAEPWNAPGILGYALEALIKSDSPLSISPTALPGLIRWGSTFLLQSRARAFERNARRNFALASYSIARHREMLAETAIDCGQAATGTIQLHREAGTCDAAWRHLAQLRAAGLGAELLDKCALLEKVPALVRADFAIAGGIFFPGDDIGDAHRFCLALANYLGERDVRFTFNAPVDRLEFEGGRVRALSSARGRFTADAFVVAAAARSCALLAPLGVRLPIYPVKGYSITLPMEGALPLGIPVVDNHRKVAMTPLGNHLRIAGTAEFSGFDERIEQRRVDMLLRDATAILPDIASVSQSAMSVWTGLRPVTPTGFPIMGRYGDNLYVNAGHGPLGWTLAAGSGKIVADLLLQQTHDLTHDALVSAAVRI